MIKFFRKIRQNLLKENKFSKYLLYAIGEIILVVIGILIALSINTKKEQTKTKGKEIQLLSGILADLEKDLEGLKGQQEYMIYNVKQDSILLSHIIEEKPANSVFYKRFYNTIFMDLSAFSQNAYYEQLKAEGLYIVSNREIRDAINNIYEYGIPYWLFLENDYLNNDHSSFAKKELMNYMEIDDTGYTMSTQKYKTLLNDKHAHFVIYNIIQMKRNLAYNDYPRIMPDIENLISAIKNELKVLRH